MKTDRGLVTFSVLEYLARTNSCRPWQTIRLYVCSCDAKLHVMLAPVTQDVGARAQNLYASSSLRNSCSKRAINRHIVSYGFGGL